MDIKKLFLELTKYTIPNGYEDLMVKFFPKNIIKDECNNYYCIIGNSRTIFTSHMDTACSDYQKVNHIIDDNYIGTDGRTVLSADDKAGMAVMLYMIKRKIPGTYYFFQGEESGMKGSSCILRKNKDFFKNYDRMISFDRRACHSIITKQLGRTCCSDLFANELAKELNKHDLNYRKDPGGIYTDSYQFIGVIPECTNLSVGYYNEHTRHETQDIDHLIKLANASCKIDWENLPLGEIENNIDQWDIWGEDYW